MRLSGAERGHKLAFTRGLVVLLEGREPHTLARGTAAVLQIDGIDPLMLRAALSGGQAIAVPHATG